MFSLSDILAKIIVHYHANCVDITNCLGQLKLISKEEWERRNWNHIKALIENPQINRAGLFLQEENEEEHS